MPNKKELLKNETFAEIVENKKKTIEKKSLEQKKFLYFSKVTMMMVNQQQLSFLKFASSAKTDTSQANLITPAQPIVKDNTTASPPQKKPTYHQIKSNQIKSNQIKSNQIKSN